ncbi:MAG: hypothetical protein ACYDCC_06795 [Actinomycetota bacterium]
MNVSTRDPDWTTQLPDTPAGATGTAALFYIRPQVGDLERDGHDDLLLQRQVHLDQNLDGCLNTSAYYCNVYWTDTIDAVGASGSELWNSTIPFGVADLTPAMDVRVVAFTGDYYADLSLLSGASGTAKWKVHYVAPAPGGSAVQVYACILDCSPDLNGNGETDILITAAGYEARDVIAHVPVTGYRGSDGAVMWQTQPLQNLLYAPSPAGADLNGDGKEDLVSFDASLADDYTIDVNVFRGFDLTPLWSGYATSTVRFPPTDAVSWSYGAGMLTGASHGEIVLDVYSVDSGPNLMESALAVQPGGPK